MDFAATDCQTKIADSSRIIINVGGFRHETSVSTLQNIPDTRLSWIAENSTVNEDNKREYFFDRHPTAFCQVLNFYRTGKLHCPTEMCGPMFEEELIFWGIDEKQMEPCCWGTYTQHREAEENLKAFVGPGFNDLKDEPAENHMGSYGSINELNCWKRIQPQLWETLDEPHSSKMAKIFSYTSCLFIALSIATFCATTMPAIRKNNIMGSREGLDHIEMFCSIFFSFELFMRLISCPSKLHFCRGIMNWIDFVAIIPFYVNIFYPNPIVRMFLVIRIMRLFRFIKLSYGLQIMIQTLKASSHELVLLLLMVLIPMVMFSSIVYYVEVIIEGRGAQFTSVPESFWWCLITMTTVGYGDMTPQTWPGKIIGGACAICGVLIVALPISVIGSNFNLYYAHAQARLKLPVKQRRLVLGGVPGLLAKPLELSSRRKKKPNRDADGESFVTSTGSNSPEMIPRRARNNLLEPEPCANDEKSPCSPLLSRDAFNDTQRGSDDSIASDLIIQRRRPRRGAPISMEEDKQPKPAEANGIILLKSRSLKGENRIYDSTPTLSLSKPPVDDTKANGSFNPLQDHLNKPPEVVPSDEDTRSDATNDYMNDARPVARIAPKISTYDVMGYKDDLAEYKDFATSPPPEDSEDDHALLKPYLFASKRKLSLSDSELFIIPPMYTNHEREPQRILSEQDVDKSDSYHGSRSSSPLRRLKEAMNAPFKEKRNKQKDFEPRGRTSTHPCVMPEFSRERRTAVIVTPLTSQATDDKDFLETKI